MNMFRQIRWRIRSQAQHIVFEWFWWLRLRHPLIGFLPILALFLVPGITLLFTAHDYGIWMRVFRSCLLVLCWLSAFKLAEIRRRFYIGWAMAKEMNRKAQVNALDGRKRDD